MIEIPLITSFISQLDANYSCCVFECNRPRSTRLCSLPFPHQDTEKRQIIHWNYAILMTIKLLIRNKKVLDVAIVISQPQHVLPLDSRQCTFIRRLRLMRAMMNGKNVTDVTTNRFFNSLASLRDQISNFKRFVNLK